MCHLYRVNVVRYESGREEKERRAALSDKEGVTEQ